MTRLRTTLFVSLLCFSARASLSGQGFTLEQVTGAPFSSSLVAAPQGDRFVWISNQRGHRNLYLAQAGASGYSTRALTHFDADDGIDIGDVTWTPDGSSVVYARGGDFEFPSKPSPNPALLAGGVTEEIWMAPADGSGEPRKIAEGHAPEVSPDGATLVYMKDGQVFSCSLREPGAKPSLLFHARGSLGSLTWSPDGHALVFTSNRGDHGFVGVFTASSKSLLYLDPSTDTDDHPVWSPDSHYIAFIRHPREVPAGGFKPQRTATPWSIRMADVGTGQSHEVWRASEGQGSAFHDLATKHQLFWVAGDRLIFPWEGDGWLHLYAVPTRGGNAQLLTPGDAEVEHVTLNADRTQLIYSSNANAGGPEGAQDLDRRHVWQISLSATPTHPRPLTRGQGIEVFPAITHDGTVAVLHADPRVPLRPAVLKRNGELNDLAPELIPADFPASKLIVPQQVLLPAADGMQIHAQLFLPPNVAPGHTHPAVVFFHGGSRREMLLGWHYMYYYSNAYAMNQYLASKGYIVLSVNYRSGIGYGLNFREALNYGAAGASEFNDVLGAGLYLRNRPDVDAARIGVWGGSYGGYLTAMALARASDLFSAGVDLHGVHDWNLGIANFDSTYNPSSEASRLAFESSPLASIKTWRSPVLLIQGDDDRNVSFSQTVRLAAALREQGVPVEQHVFPDEIHDFLLWRDWVEAYRLGADFFSRKLVAAPAGK